MNNKKLLISLITVVFIGVAGFVYCLGARRDSESDVIFTTGAKESIVTDIDVDVDESAKPEVDNQLDESDQNDTKNNTVASYIYVHVCGEVNNPEVYQLEKGTRVRDVIAMAGGFTPNAAVNFLNQARELQDGEKVYIPSLDEEKELDLPTQMQSEITESNNSNPLKVNINKATLADLMTLRGIGEAKAKSIIEYREANGTFSSIEELKNITGIKDGVLDKIRDSITVD